MEKIKKITPLALLDSSVVIAFFHPLDSNHEKARLLISEYENKDFPFILHPLVFVETLTILKKKARQTQLITAQASLANQEVFQTPDDALLWYEKKQYLEFFNGENNLSMIDAILLGFSLKNNFILLTFDRNLEKIYTKLKKQR